MSSDGKLEKLHRKLLRKLLEKEENKKIIAM